MEGLSARPQQGEASDLRKIQEDPLTLPPGRSAHLPGGVALDAQIAMEGTVHSDAAVAGAAPEAPLEVVLAVAVGVAKVVDRDDREGVSLNRTG